MTGLLMSAILSDTVLLKSPTCTARDLTTVEKLAKIARIADPMTFGMEMFRVKSNIASRSASELVTGDAKRFDFNGTTAIVGQIEVMDLKELAPGRSAILQEMNKLKDTEKLDMVVVMVTDIIRTKRQSRY